MPATPEKHGGQVGIKVPRPKDFRILKEFGSLIRQVKNARALDRWVLCWILSATKL